MDHKIARKMQASKEVWGKIFGRIDMRRKFLEHRLELAKREWARMKANDSLECRNCHTAAAMDLTRQTERAAGIHSRYLLTGQATCIDCHKGIAHELPNMEGVDPGWKVPAGLRGLVHLELQLGQVSEIARNHRPCPPVASLEASDILCAPKSVTVALANRSAGS